MNRLPAPQNDPADGLKNRRFLAFYAFGFILLWPIVILAADLWHGVDTGKVVAYLGYAGTFGSSPIVAYFLACRAEGK